MVGPVAMGRISPGWSVSNTIIALAVAQIALLVLGGCGAVQRALTRDHVSRMLESHRLSPLSGSSVAFGYVFGAPMQFIVLFLITLIWGAARLRVAGLPVEGWIAGNLLLFATAAMYWSVAVCSGVGHAKPVNLLGIMLVSSVASAAVVLIPGLALVTGAYSISAAFMAMMGRFELNPPTSVVASTSLNPAHVGGLMLASLMWTMLWLSGAARRFRRPDRPAFDALWATVMLLTWLVLSGTSIAILEDVQRLQGELPHPRTQFVVTLVLSLIWCALPLSGAGIDRARILKGARPGSWEERVSSRWLILAGTVLVCGVLAICKIRWVEDNGVELTSALGRNTLQSWALTAITMVLGLLALDGVLRIRYLTQARALGPASLYVIVAWLLPVAVDYARGVYAHWMDENPYAHTDFTLLLSCSPMGVMMKVWSKLSAPLLPGLAVQIIIAASLTALAVRAERRELARRRAERPAVFAPEMLSSVASAG